MNKDRETHVRTSIPDQFLSSETQFKLLHKLEKRETYEYPRVKVDQVTQLWGDPLEADMKLPYTVMRFSDLELASQGGNVTGWVSEAEAQGTIRGVAGHMIGSLVNELTRQVREGKNVTSGALTQEGIKPEIKNVIDSQVHAVVGHKPKVHLTRVPFIAEKVWDRLKKDYIFWKVSKKEGLKQGDQFSAKWVKEYWMSEEMKAYAQSLFEIHENRIGSYWTQDLFNETVFLPMESDPVFNLATEKPIMLLVHFNGYQVQFKGRADYTLHGRAVIDEKYGSPDGLHTKAGRIQALLYSDGMKQTGYPKRFYNQLSPEDTIFYYHWYDTRSEKHGSYYIDGTVLPDEYPQILSDMAEFTHTWWTYEDYFKEIKKQRSNALILPYLTDIN